MDDGIDAEGETSVPGRRGCRQLRGVHPAPRHDVTRFGLVRLEADLDMAEAGVGQRGRPSGAEAHPARDQVRVEPATGSLGDELLEVGPEEGLAPAEVQVQDTEPGGLTDHAPPFGWLQLLRPLGQGERIRAVDAPQRAGVGELGDQ